VTPSRRLAKTRPATSADANAYLAKAREFLRAAVDSRALGNNAAAAGNVVHAGIAGTDAIATIRIGAVWIGEHSQAAGHVEGAAGSDGRQAAAQLRRLIPLKNRAEYDPRPVTAGEAAAAVKAAERIVTIAERVVGSR
jgi:hypothetical protein